MTDNEIIKALECCSQEDKCLECPYGAACLDDRYVSRVSKDALDLINRQKAEIERYLHSIKLLEKDVAEKTSELEKIKKMTVNKIAVMGMKVFAERLKKKANSRSYCAIWVSDVDNLLKEMEGEE